VNFVPVYSAIFVEENVYYQSLTLENRLFARNVKHLRGITHQMTTIAAKFSTLEIAADTSVSGEDSSYMTSKIRFGEESIYGACGDWDKCLKAFQLIESKSNDWDTDLDVTILELRKDGLWIYESTIIPARLKNDYWAVGTGANFAISAMRLGNSPATAVLIAAEFDPFTNDAIETFKLGDNNGNQGNRRRVQKGVGKVR
jgi:hypothetical protein